MQALIGRDTELHRLEEAVERARAGAGGVVVVMAEGGGGKTALLEAFAGRARPAVMVAWGDAYEGEGAPPFWPWVQLLRQLATAPAHAAAAAEALEQLTAASDEAGRFAAFDAAARALTAGGPLLVVLDDLHWADGGSLQLLEFVAPQARRAPLLIVAGCRPSGDPALEVGLAALLRRGGERIELRPLTAAEVGRQLAAEGAPPSATPEVARLSGGNPLYVRELARHLAAGGRASDVPRSLTGIIQAEARRTSAEAGRLLAVCAVFDGPIPPALAAAAAGTSLAPFEELEAAALLVRREDALRFRHDLVREALRAAIPHEQRLRLEAALAGAAAAIGDATLVAVHGCRAGEAWDPARAHAAALEQSRLAAGQYAVESAAAFALLARRVRPLLALPGPDLLAIEVADGEVLTAAGRGAEGREVFRGAAALARQAGDQLALARIALRFGLGHEYGNAHDPEVVAFLREALAGLPEGEHAMRARVLARLAWQELTAGAMANRDVLSAEAVREGRMSEDPGALAAALEARCWALGRSEHLAECHATAIAAVDAARDAGDLNLELGGLLWCFRCELAAGNVAGARDAARRFEAITTRWPLPYHRWYADLFRGCLALIDGRVDDAIAAAEAIDPAATGQEVMARVNRQTLIGHIGLARGGQAVVDGLRQMAAVLRDDLRIEWLMTPHLAALERGAEAGRAELDAAMRTAASYPADEDALIIRASLAAAAILCGARDHAETLFAQLLPFAGLWIVVANGAACRGPVAAVLAGLARCLGRPDEARAFAARAEAALDASGAHGLREWLDLAPLPAANPAPTPRGGLSAREAEVLALVARGHSNREIADALVLSVRTVQRHVENAYLRLGVHNRASATLAAVELGLVAPGDVREAATG